MVDRLLTEAWRPEPAEVKQYIPQRHQTVPLRQPDGDPLPQDVDLEGLITSVMSDIETECGDPIPVRWQTEARQVAALGAASYLEQGLFPEQSQVEWGANQTLERRYLARLRRLSDRIDSDQSGGLQSVETIGPTRLADERMFGGGW